MLKQVKFLSKEIHFLQASRNDEDIRLWLGMSFMVKSLLFINGGENKTRKDLKKNKKG